MLGAQREIFARIQASELLKVVDEVCLVIIAGRKCDVDPIDCVAILNGTNHLLKPEDATKELWPETNFIAKKVDELSLTEANRIRHFGAGNRRISLKLRDGV